MIQSLQDGIHTGSGEHIFSDLEVAALVIQWGDEWRHFVYKTWRPSLDDYDAGIGDQSLTQNREYEYDNHETENDDLDNFDW